MKTVDIWFTRSFIFVFLVRHSSPDDDHIHMIEIYWGPNLRVETDCWSLLPFIKIVRYYIKSLDRVFFFVCFCNFKLWDTTRRLLLLFYFKIPPAVGGRRGSDPPRLSSVFSLLLILSVHVVGVVVVLHCDNDLVNRGPLDVERSSLSMTLFAISALSQKRKTSRF